MNTPFKSRKKTCHEDFDWPETLHPLLKRIYTSRLERDFSETDLSLANLLDPMTLKGVEQAAVILLKAIQNQARILIVGDFDVDGATSTALAIRALPLFGATNLSYLVPNRFDFGYGLSVALVKAALKDKPDLIVTVDNGISSLEGVAFARQQGIDVVITDHHLPGDALPQANAIVNPNQPHDEFASKNLCGVGVMFYLLLALRKIMREQGSFEQMLIAEPNLAAFLDLVALGTVADVVPLDRNNRILVREGLKRIRQDQCCPGITALLRVAERTPANVVAADMGFAVGPRLNAAGRLDDMTIGIECLLADKDRAYQLAQQLNDLNLERRSIEADMKQTALEYLESLQTENADLFGITLFDESWHQGVIGILASRVKEKLHRPVVIMAPGDDGEIKGSARSIPGVHIRDVLAAIDALHPGIIVKFGGHAMAAGLTIKASGYEEFARAFDQQVERVANEDILSPQVLTDGELQIQEFNLQTVELLENAGPWGQGFPEPLFAGEFEVVSQRVLKDKHYKLVLKPQLAADHENLYLDGIAFNRLEGHESDVERQLPTRIFVSYRLNANEFNGRTNLQLMIDNIHTG